MPSRLGVGKPIPEAAAAKPVLALEHDATVCAVKVEEADRSTIVRLRRWTLEHPPKRM